MVRSKSEVIIANMLFDRDISFRYEEPLFAPDGTFYLPDFTITGKAKTGTGSTSGDSTIEEYRNHWETKKAWYEANFPGRLLTTEETAELSTVADTLIRAHFA